MRAQTAGTTTGHDEAPTLHRGLMLFALAIYAFTLHPDVAGGDSGEYVTVAVTRGVAHPSGYPLHAIISWFFLWIPIGSAGAKVNFLSAVCGALTAGVTCRLVTRWTGCMWSGLAAGGLFAFAPLVWGYATVAEVFALNNLLVALVFAAAYELATAAPSRQMRASTQAAFLVGLGLTNHHTFVFPAFGLVVWALWARPELRGARAIGLLASFAVMGLTPYLYLPLAAAGHPPVCWGDPSTPQGFLHHVMRSDYGTLRLAGTGYGPPPALTEQLGWYFTDVLDQTLGLAWLLAIPGLVWAFRGVDRSTLHPGTTHRLLAGLTVASVVIWVGYLLVFHTLANIPLRGDLLRGVVARFWQQALWPLCLWIGLGLHGVGQLLGRSPAPIALLLVVAQIGLHYRACDEHLNTHVGAYGRAILEPLPSGAILLTKGDLVTNSVRYAQWVGRIRTDVICLDQSLMSYPWFRPWIAARHPSIRVPPAPSSEPLPIGLLSFLEQNVGSFRVYVAGGLREGEAALGGKFDTWPWGLTELLVRTGEPVDLAAWIEGSRKALPRYPLPDPTRYGPGTWEGVVESDAWVAHSWRGTRLLKEAISHGDDPSLLAQSIDEFETVTRKAPRPPIHAWKNLGLARARQAQREPQRSIDAARAWTRYLEGAGNDDKDIPAIREFVKQNPLPQ